MLIFSSAFSIKSPRAILNSVCSAQHKPLSRSIVGWGPLSVVRLLRLPFTILNQVKVQVILQLTVSQDVHYGVEPLVGHMTIFLNT